jgi:hypothetical protein
VTAAGSEDEIPVSPKMAIAGAHAIDGSNRISICKQAIDTYRAMEWVRRAEADAEVVRRSVRP